MKILKSLIAIKNAFFYSMSGLRFLAKERAFFQEILLLPLIVFAVAFFEAEAIMKLYLVSAYFLVIITEALNTAIEAVVDRIGSEFHDLSKKAKDISSAAVFLTFIHLAIVFLIYLMLQA